MQNSISLGAAPRPGRSLASRLTADWGFTLGALVLLLIVSVAILAPWIAPFDPLAQDIANRRVPPFWQVWGSAEHQGPIQHILGTDKLGRDYLSRILYGARISLIVGVVTVIISGLIGTLLGVLAGYYGGAVDAVVSFLITTRLSIPVVLVALAVVATHGSSLTIIVLVLGLLLWDRFAVVMRSVTQVERRREYVATAQVIGCSTPRIIFMEIFPNVMSTMIVIASLEMANAILFEAALSFLGLGVQPPTPSWGLMLAEAKEEIFFSAWMITIPGVALFLLVLSVNLIGDGVKDFTSRVGQK